jgi:excisionase family DNA binding protein
MKIIETKEMCDILGVSRVTLNKLREQGLPHYKMERRVKYNVDDVLKWLEKEKGVNYDS